MRGLIVLGVLVTFIIITLFLARPFLAVYIYYWLAFMAPLHVSYSLGSGIPWSQIVVVTMCATVLISKNKLNKKVFGDSTIVFMTLLFAWTGITTLVAHFPVTAQESFADNIKIWLVAVMCAMLMNTRERLHYLVWILVLSIGFHTVQAGVITIFSGGGAKIYGPAKSAFNTENPFARITIMILPLMLFLFHHSRNTLVRKSVLGATLLDVMALVGTGSRGGFIAFCAMAAYSWFRSKRKFIFTFLLLLAGIAATALLSDDRIGEWTDRMSTIGQAEEVHTAQQRFDAWFWAMDYANDHPIFGGGFGVFRLNIQVVKESEAYLLAHSNFFQILGEHGYVGLALYMLMIFAVFMTCRRIEIASRGRPEVYWERDLAISLRIATIGYIVGGITITHDFFELFYVYVGMVAATRSLVVEKIGLQAYKGKVKQSNRSGSKIVITPTKDASIGGYGALRSARMAVTGQEFVLPDTDKPSRV